MARSKRAMSGSVELREVLDLLAERDLTGCVCKIRVGEIELLIDPSLRLTGKDASPSDPDKEAEKELQELTEGVYGASRGAIPGASDLS